MNIADIQKALATKGFDPGNIDGIWGRRTQAAVRAFQLANGLQADGIVGPVTTKALFGVTAEPPPPLDDVALPWFQEARRLRGLKEGPAGKNNMTILQWAADEGIPYKSDDIPWCGLFVAHCIGSTLPSEPLPAGPLAARSWMKFGAACTVRPGAVLVFWRGKRDGFQGHVGFYAGEDAKAFSVLGGNQSIPSASPASPRIGCWAYAGRPPSP